MNMPKMLILKHCLIKKHRTKIIYSKQHGIRMEQIHAGTDGRLVDYTRTGWGDGFTAGTQYFLSGTPILDVLKTDRYLLLQTKLEESTYTAQ